VKTEQHGVNRIRLYWWQTAEWYFRVEPDGGENTSAGRGFR